MAAGLKELSRLPVSGFVISPLATTRNKPGAISPIRCENGMPILSATRTLPPFRWNSQPSTLSLRQLAPVNLLSFHATLVSRFRWTAAYRRRRGCLLVNVSSRKQPRRISMYGKPARISFAAAVRASLREFHSEHVSPSARPLPEMTRYLYFITSAHPNSQFHPQVGRSAMHI